MKLRKLTVHSSIDYFSGFQEEDEVDQGTMVRAGPGDSATMRAAGSRGNTLNAADQRDPDSGEEEEAGTMRLQLGTMIINSEDEEEAGTMKSMSMSSSPKKNKNVLDMVRAPHEAANCSCFDSCQRVAIVPLAVTVAQVKTNHSLAYERHMTNSEKICATFKN